ncbi:MAG: metal ABC transporter permease [Rhodothermales bacterium]
MLELFSDYTFRTVALGAAMLGIVSGALGTFAVLRKQSLLGDAIAHAALPGIALAFLITGTKSPLGLMLGAMAAGWIATLLVSSISISTRVSYDSALGTILSVFFGFGLVLLTVIQKMPNANQAGLSTFLFGQAAALVTQEVITMCILGAIALTPTVLFWKEFKVLAFDPEYGQSLGFPMRFLDFLLTSLLVIAIVIGLQTVGVVLMSAMIIAPAVAARQWTNSLGIMVCLGAGFGAISGVAGAYLSSSFTHLPTGPTIVLAISGIVVVSLFLAPNRGLVWRWVRNRRNARKLKLDAVLLDVYALAAQHSPMNHPHSEAVLNVMNEMSAKTDQSLERLSELGLVQKVVSGEWALTATGQTYVEQLMQDRFNPDNR